ncbi:unnamed protein product [Dicrocoelium dendriticum]|nr:unnamed protein product [Dicrocoelium dendriticum]
MSGLRTTTTLNELVEPVTQWIQRTTYGLLLPMEPVVIHNKSAEPNNNLHYGNSLNFQPLGLGNASLLVQTPDSAGLSGQNIPLQVGMGNFSGRTEEKPSFSRETLITNQNFGKIGQYNLLPVGMTSTLSASLSAQMEIPPTDPTSTVLPSAQSTTRNNMQVNQARYFTFDGQHRKFYLDARYLRSAERQRRHKRRMAKRMREQMRLEENRLRNALSYGNIDAIRRKTMTGRNRTSGKPPEQTLEILSLDSDTETEVSIPLICWKDIDLDLEVRSIDDEKELSKLVDESPQVTPFTTSTLPQSTQASRVGQLDSRKMSHRTEKANAVYQETSAGVEFQGMETSDSTKIMKWIQNNKPRALLAPSITSGVQAAGTVKDAKTASMKQDDCVRKTNVANFTIFENPLAQDMESASDDNYPITMEKTRPVPSDKQTLPANVATSTEVKRSRIGRTGTEALCDIRSTHPSTSAESRYCPKFSTLQFNSTNVTQFPPINSSQRFQRQHAQSLANSVVIQNRAATERMEDESVEKALAQGKSRLSIASSRGDPNSDVQVQLSYYSKQDSAHTEEDLSLFTFGDGFSSEEDISKVTVPISLSLLIMATYIVIGAIVFSIWEDKKYLKWSYFCFITLSTIGFGDIVPGTKIDSENTKEKLVIISLYVAIGLSVFAMCFKLMQEEVVHKVKWLASKVGIIKGKTKKKQEKSL